MYVDRPGVTIFIMRIHDPSGNEFGLAVEVPDGMLNMPPVRRVMRRENMSRETALKHLAKDALRDWVNSMGWDGDDVEVLEVRPGTADEANSLAEIPKGN